MRLNPVAYWPFVEGTGNILHDFTKNNNHGTIYGALWNTLDPGHNHYLNFDGVDDYVNCGADPSLNTTEGISVISWINHTVDAFEGIISRDIAANRLWFMGSEASARQKTRIYNTAGVPIELTGTTNDVPLNSWHQTISTYDKNNVAILVDGTFLKQTPWSETMRTSLTEPLHIGRLYSNSYCFEGAIGQTVMFNYGLTPTQCASIFLTQKQNFGV